MTDKTKCFTKAEYVQLIPPVSSADYDRLKQSIKKQNGLLMPIILNQDNVVLDGHHRLRACKELGIPISFAKKDFTNKPLEELDYVVSVNLDRRHLDEFQRAEIALKYDKLYRKIARDAWASVKYNSETGKKAAKKRWSEERGEEEEQEEEDDPDFDEDPDTSVDNNATPVREQEPHNPADIDAATPPTSHVSATREALAGRFGVSASTLERVNTILQDGSPEQIQALRDKNEKGEGPGVRTVFEQVQQEKLKEKLQPEAPAEEVKRDNLKLLNKDFRVVTKEDIPDSTVDLVLVLDFPEPRVREDEAGRQYQQLMDSAQNWLKDGGMLAMHVEPRFLPRAICEKPPLLQFYDILSVFETGLYELRPTRTMFQQECRHIAVYVKGVRDTRPNTPQQPSTNRIGGAGENWGSQQAFAAELIKRLSPEASTVVSPFMGQSKGVDGLAATDVGRLYVGIEPETTQYLSALNLLYE